ncbi:nuclear factor of activated T-cells, cytoplasmic 2 isoform X2 [Eucyclogobius newberryi]|uniref:nuclear factor of activated T-cells, cytoplasmic 2 isoform X2 n=1 Tax=Eucyclogobius newberryi TaxID=166745 RepID=UPI003B5C628D
MSAFYEHKELEDDLRRADCPEDDFQFEDLFEYEAPRSDAPDRNRDDPNLGSHKVLSPDTGHSFQLEEPSPYRLKSCSPSYSHGEALPGYDHPEPRGGYHLALSPRIEITPSREHFQHDPLHNQHQNLSPRPTLTVPGHENLAYREPQCLSPASSNSSTSWHSECYSPWASPCVSPSNSAQNTGDLCPRFQNIHTGSPRTSPGTSPGTSPRTSLTEDGVLGPRSLSPRAGSRSTSPQGKRTYDMYRNQGLVPGHRSRSPSPHDRHDDPGLGAHYASLGDAMNGYGAAQQAGLMPTKIVKTANQLYTLYPENSGEHNYLLPCEQELKSKPAAAEPFFVIPQIWSKPLVPGLCSIPVSSLPPLEWPLPSRTDQYELHVEVQPRPHHRAHYETEGSRGAVKAPTGGHPVVQLHGYRGNEPLGLQIFIGTADERILKPHAFYQVHRITGKTVTTSSYEKVFHGTKVLEIPLEPKNNMKAIIDCAGILKLRNADIELRKGETDVGRKNTRVRLVFRVHVPQAGGTTVSLQAASHPIECSQRSAHELPLVERQDMDSCCVLGGQQMILSGHNFSSDSKVVFMEKTQDGQQIWEMEATVDKDKSQPSMLFVEVPSYRDSNVLQPVKVNFYVINGKRKRSQPQHFTYTPMTSPSIKSEPLDEYEGFVMPQMFYHSQRGVRHPDNNLISSMSSCLGSGLSPQADEGRFQQQSPAIVFSRGGKALSSDLYQQHAPIDPHHRSVLVHTGSPVQHPSIIQFSPTNQHLLPRAGEALAPPPTENQQVVYCEGYSPQGHTSPHHQPYSTVIQQQFIQKTTPPPPPPPPPAPQQQKARAPSDPPADPRRRVTVKEENLDQAYLDDVNEIIRKDLTGVQARAHS